MEKLREDYKTGERFYAQDMNKITHVVNELEERTEIVDELPETGEDGVIYAVEDAKIEEQSFCQVAKIDEDFIIEPTREFFNNSILKIGDVIKFSDDAVIDNSYVIFTSIDKETFTIFRNEDTEVIGVNEFLTPSKEYFYRITDIFEVPKEHIEIPEIKQYNGAYVFAYVFEEIEAEGEYDYEVDFLGSVELRVLQVPIMGQVAIPVALVNINNNTHYGIIYNSEYYSLNIPQIGDVIKVTENNKFLIDGITISGMCVSSIDENIIDINFDFMPIITGITEASEWQKDHFYIVTGEYKAHEVEDGRGLTDEVRLFTYDEVLNPETVNYETPFLPSAHILGYYKDLNIYKKYIWIKDHFETFDDKTDVVTSSFVSSIWKGTQEEYDNISEKDPKVLYVIIN